MEQIGLASCESPILDGKNKKPSRHSKRVPVIESAEVAVESVVDNPAKEFDSALRDICFEVELSPDGSPDKFILTYGFPKKSYLMTGRELAEKLLIKLSEECQVHLCSKNLRVVEVGYTNMADGRKRWFVRINDNVYEVLMFDYRDSVINIKYQDEKTKTEKEIMIYPKSARYPIVPEKKIVPNLLEHGWYRLWPQNPLNLKPLDSTSFCFKTFNEGTLMRRCDCNHSDNSHRAFQYYLVKIVETGVYVVPGNAGKKNSIKKKLTVEILEYGFKNGESLITPQPGKQTIEFYEI